MAMSMKETILKIIKSTMLFMEIIKSIVLNNNKVIMVDSLCLFMMKDKNINLKQ